jgi:chromosome partitioning protein
MRVLALAAQKGGSGKTTLSGHLAVEAERAGAGPVAILDTDPQHSLLQWRNSRAAATPVLAKATLPDLSGALDELREAGIKLVVVDTPPAITISISNVIAHADLVLIPTRPSPHDLRAVGATVDMAERHGKPLVFVINAATARARITGEAAVALSQHGTVAPVTIHQRVDFVASMVDGRTAGEVVPESASAKEIRDLWTYVQDRLARLPDQPVLRVAPSPPRLQRALEVETSYEDEQLFSWSSQTSDDSVTTYLAGEAEAQPQTAVPDQAVSQPVQTDSDRRSGTTRRSHNLFLKPFGSPERRAHPFGRRSADRPANLGDAAK